MKFRLLPVPETLDAWLEVATKGLAREAQGEVAREYTAHYDEAVLAKGREGLHGYGAEQEALRELGDALALRRKLRAARLTENEAHFLSIVGGRPSDATRFPRATAVANLGVFGFAVAVLALGSGVWFDDFLYAGGHFFFLWHLSDSLPYAAAAIFQSRKRLSFTRETARVLAAAQATFAVAGMVLFAECWSFSREAFFVADVYSFAPEIWIEVLPVACMCYEAFWMQRLARKLPGADKLVTT